MGARAHSATIGAEDLCDVIARLLKTCLLVRRHAGWTLTRACGQVESTLHLPPCQLRGTLWGPGLRPHLTFRASASATQDRQPSVCDNRGMVRPERRILLAGARPVRVSAGAPGSRPQPGEEIPWARAGRQKPVLSREQRSGPQLEVNAAASSDYQPKGDREGRAAHITAKATDSGLVPERPLDLSGVGAAARFDRRRRNRRGPPRPPTSDKDRAYKAGRLKSCGAGRESEGSVVPAKAARNRWREGALL